MQNKLQTRGLIQIISQLPVNSIIRINNQSIRNDNIFNLIKDYEMKLILVLTFIYLEFLSR